MMKKLKHNFSSICQPQCRLPQTIQPYITRKQPISIDLPASKYVYALKLFAWYFSSSWIHIVIFVFGLVLCQSPIPSSLSFVTQSHLIRFHHKFPIILLHFISLEFVFFFLRSLSLSLHLFNVSFWNGNEKVASQFWSLFFCVFT